MRSTKKKLLLRKDYLLILSLLLVIAASGCASVRNQGVVVALQADPPIVFSNSYTTLHMDIDNRQDKNVYNVVADVFDTGLLQADRCRKEFERLLRYEFQSFPCGLYAPSIEEKSLETEINARVTFESDLSATQVFEVVSEMEYERRVAAGTYEARQRSYAYSDKNVLVEVDFNEPLPLVIRPGKKYFVYFTIINIGEGFILPIRPGEFTQSPVNTKNPLLVECPRLAILHPNEKTFPRIACEVVLPQDYSWDGSYNSDFLMNLRYTYEMRSKLRIDVIR